MHAALRAVSSKRRFQAGVKLWLACSAALAVAVVIAVSLPGLSPSVTMFGFMALVFTMRERVESSAEMVRGGSIECCVCCGSSSSSKSSNQKVFCNVEG